MTVLVFAVAGYDHVADGVLVFILSRGCLAIYICHLPFPLLAVPGSLYKYKIKSAVFQKIPLHPREIIGGAIDPAMNAIMKDPKKNEFQFPCCPP